MSQGNTDQTDGHDVNGFTVTVVLYGAYPLLARRSLGSIVNSIDCRLVRSLRVGMNACCDETRQYVLTKLATLAAASDVQLLLYDAGQANRLKYPVLRKMLYDSAHPVVTPYVMHFDDDSAIDRNDPWWREVYDATGDADLLGSVYTVPAATANVIRAIRDQPWYTGRRPDLRFPCKFRFATGGWWVARTRILQRWDYPFKEIVHNGGDAVLGEMVRQQGLRLKHFNSGVWINAGVQGEESKAPRRGESRRPVWADYNPARPADYSHHDFELPGVDVLAAIKATSTRHRV